MMKKLLLIGALAFVLTACVSHLQQGQQAFEQQDYATAMQELLPLAEKGDPAVQYAVGYMYYYGKGVKQDKAVGKMWIDRAADQGLPQALQAQTVIEKQAALNPLKTP